MGGGSESWSPSSRASRVGPIRTGDGVAAVVTPTTGPHVELGVLGPLEVVGPDGVVRIGGAKERLVLALLVLRAGEIVSRDALVDALWGDRPPPTAVKTLQGYVARVRRALEGVGMDGALVTRAPGYVLSVAADSTDADGFERHAGAGRQALADGDVSRAAGELATALDLWRGDALCDCRSGGWAAPEAIRLDELRLSTIEDRIDADLRLGRHTVLVSELESLVVRHPLRERMWGALMLALYRSDRQADAVRAYQRARDVLVRELGLEPGAELRRLEAAVLVGDATVGWTDADPAPDVVDRHAQGGIPLPRRLAAVSSSVFVGRAQERGALRTAFKVAAAGERRIVLMSGEPGIGKTSLAAAFAREAVAAEGAVSYGRYDEDLGIPYQPWAEVLTHLVGHTPDEVLAEHVGICGDVLGRLVPSLARSGRTPTSSDAESERFLLFGAVVDLLARISARAPLVLVLDDLHWADRPTVQLLRHVVSAEAPLRLLVIGTFRDSDLVADHPLAEALAALHREPGVERMSLRGFDHDELLELLEATAGHEMPEEGLALRDALLAETGGNPFFVGEMVRHLAETQSIYQDEQGRWVASRDLRTAGLPVSVREVIGRRVARLGPPTQAVLSHAAVIGRDFDVDVLAVVTGLDEDHLIGVCDQAVDAAVLTGSADAGRYTFTHALIEHALYGSLSSGRRGRAHRAVAEALEEMCGDDPGDRIGQLAHHWARATQPPDPGKAMVYAQRAGDRALAMLAPDEALRWYGVALDLLGGRRDDQRRRAELLLGLGDAQRQTGDPAHRETLLAAGRLADDVGFVEVLVGAVLRNNRGYNSLMGRVDRDRVDMCRRALARLGEADSPDRARLISLLCVEGTWDADFDERLSMANEAVGIARRTGDRAALVDAIRLCHEAITMPQTLELRRRWDAEACDLADELGDRIARLKVHDCRCLNALEAGDLATMRQAYAIFESESERVGQPFIDWQVAYHRAWRLALEGDLVAGEQAAADAFAVGTAAGHPDDAMTVYGGQFSVVRWMQGRLREMIPLTEQAVRDNPGLGIFRAALAAAMSAHEPRDEVWRFVDRACAEGFEVFTDASWLAAQTLWANAVARAGHRAGAALLYDRLAPWHRHFATSHMTVHGPVAHYLGLLAHTLERHDEADHWFAEALMIGEAMEAPFFATTTQVAWAGLLADRARSDDARRARNLVDAALPIAVERGFGYVEGDARAVLTLLG